jgi:hypothetical protein
MKRQQPGSDLTNTLVACLAIVGLGVAAVAQAPRPGANHPGAAAAMGPRVVAVPAGGNLAAALKAAKAGDVIELEPGAVYDGSFTLPVFDGDRIATLRTRGSLPDRRLGMADVPLLATLRSTVAGEPPLKVPDGAHHWRVDGVAITQTGGNTYGMVRLGESDRHASVAAIPHHLELDRLVVYVGDAITERRGIQVNANDVTIRRSSILNIKEAGADSQGIAGWDTQGRITIDDCEIQAAGENVFFGGGNASAEGVMPVDVTVTNNDIRKPLSWRGQRWTVKNLIEFKAGRHVTVRGNRLDGNWVSGQSGYAILFTPRNQDGHCKWCAVEDVLFEHNRLDHSASGINILAFDNETRPEGRHAEPAQRITIRQNLLRLDAKTFGGEGRCYMLLLGPANITIDHNTCIADGGAVLLVDGPKAKGFVFTNNLQQHNLYGIIGAGTAPGTPTIAAFFDAPIIAKNVFAGAHDPYPPGNQTPPVASFLNEFVNAAMGDFRLKPGSSFRHAGTDGTDLGANIE